MEGSTVKYKSDREGVVKYLTNWLQQFNEVQMWADVPHYDWVLFLSIIWGSMNLPNNLHYMCLDLATLLLANGIDYKTERISLLDQNEIPETYQIHNALCDAELTLVLVKNTAMGNNRYSVHTFMFPFSGTTYPKIPNEISPTTTEPG